jgi:hypothetical protein
MKKYVIVCISMPIQANKGGSGCGMWERHSAICHRATLKWRSIVLSLPVQWVFRGSGGLFARRKTRRLDGNGGSRPIILFLNQNCSEKYNSVCHNTQHNDTQDSDTA